MLAFNKYYDLPGTEIFELSEFLFKFRPAAAIDPDFAKPFPGPFTYHDPCHNLKSLKLQSEVRHFLEQFGDRYRDDDSALCCGFGGIFKVGFPATSARILDKKTSKLDELGVGAVVTVPCPGCYMQLKESLDLPVFFSVTYSRNSDRKIIAAHNLSVRPRISLSPERPSYSSPFSLAILAQALSR